MTKKICAFCKYLGMGVIIGGYFCGKTGLPVNPDDACDDVEVVS